MAGQRLYDPYSHPPTPVGGDALGNVQLAEVTVYNTDDGTVDAKLLTSRATMIRIPVPGWYVPTVGDRVFVADRDGDPRQPLCLGYYGPQDGSVKAPQTRSALAKWSHYDGSTVSYNLTTSLANPNTNHFQATLKTAANPVRVRLMNALVQGTAADTLTVSMFVDGNEATTHRLQPTVLVTGTTFWQSFSFEDESSALSAGTHVIELRMGKSNALNNMTVRSGEGFGVVGSTIFFEEVRLNNTNT